MKKKKIKTRILSWLDGSVLFEWESEDNTVAKTVTEAVNKNADLRYANLRSADLRYANLSYANLGYADLSYADLRYADLSYADLSSADLSSADLRYAKNADWVIAMTRILPEGEIVGWKKCRDGVIVKLIIPKEAKRSHAFGRKCRAEYAVVDKLYNAKGKKVAYSTHDSTFEYRKGETVKPKNEFSDDWVDECASGIHFFITRLEAENY